MGSRFRIKPVPVILVVATDKGSEAQFPKSTTDYLFRSSSNPMRSIWPGDWLKPSRKMRWKLPRELEF